MNARRAFTLIELLVVIAVIALLMAILMPALNKAKKQARMIICRSNLRSYATAARLYADDNDFEFPFSFQWLYNVGGVNCNWHDASNNLDRHPELAGDMWQYLKGLDIHLCPDFDVVARMMGCHRCDGRAIPVEPQYGYTMNSYLHGDAWNSVPQQYRQKIADEGFTKETMVKNPSRVFYFAEENSWVIPGLNVAGINDNNLRSVPSGGADSFATFHKAPKGDLNLGFCNASFVDGHVEMVSAYPEDPIGNTFVLSWPAGGTPPSW